MKRNEKLLVYGVTGFLAVIVLVAILFGEGSGLEGRQRAERPGDGEGGPRVERRLLDDLLSNTPEESAGSSGSAGSAPAADPGGGSLGMTPAVTAGSPGDASPASFSLSTRASQEDPAARVARLLGPSQVMAPYRRVTIQRGQGLDELLLRWCPNQADARQLVPVLNENLVGDNPLLRAGDTVLLPLVADADLLAAWEARTAAPANPSATSSGGAASNPGSNGGAPSAAPPATSGSPAGTGRARAGDAKVHTVKKGESAWRIAQKYVPSNKIPAYLEQVKALNPGIKDLASLPEGTKLKLPR